MNHKLSIDNLIKQALDKDAADQLKKYRNEFHIPKHTDGNDIIYFCGNSLGLQPKSTQKYVDDIMMAWKDRAVEGHFMGSDPWMNYHDDIEINMAEVVGAKPEEVGIMNTLTVNLHMLMVSFYRPTQKKNKILIDYSAFPSDIYAATSQIKFHGFNPDECLIELNPQPKSEIVTMDEIRDAFEVHGDELALALIAGVNYYTGQAYPMKEIVSLARKYDCRVGFDLAHAAGNLPLSLHADGPDFAAWCTYKYLNSGPGNLSGFFVHERHHHDKSLPKFVGWWGNDRKNRFQMEKSFTPAPGVESWVASNPPVIALAGIKASTDMFKEAGFMNLRKKSEALTAFLEYAINQISTDKIEIITPSDPSHRGCQLSIRVKGADRRLFDALRTEGVIGDWREPDVIRVAPVPFYNSFMDVCRFTEKLEKCLRS